MTWFKDPMEGYKGLNSLNVFMRIRETTEFKVQNDHSWSLVTCMTCTNHQTFVGLCGNFNNIQADDFTTISGLREATAVDFANTWKTRASCADVKRTFENPCSLSLENGKLFLQPAVVATACDAKAMPSGCQHQWSDYASSYQKYWVRDILFSACPAMPKCHFVQVL